MGIVRYKQKEVNKKKLELFLKKVKSDKKYNFKDKK